MVNLMKNKHVSKYIIFSAGFAVQEVIFVDPSVLLDGVRPPPKRYNCNLKKLSHWIVHQECTILWQNYSTMKITNYICTPTIMVNVLALPQPSHLFKCDPLCVSCIKEKMMPWHLPTYQQIMDIRHESVAMFRAIVPSVASVKLGVIRKASNLIVMLKYKSVF